MVYRTTRPSHIVTCITYIIPWEGHPNSFIYIILLKCVISHQAKTNGEIEEGKRKELTENMKAKRSAKSHIVKKELFVRKLHDGDSVQWRWFGGMCGTSG